MGKGATFEAAGTLAKVCKCCGAVATSIPLKKCTGCKIVFYCFEECEKRDWKEGATRSNATV